MTKKLVATFGPDGKLRVDAQGFNGRGCATTIDKLLKAMGDVTVVDRQSKPEFFDTEHATDVAAEGGGNGG